jgi:hypothetical protein
MEKGSVLVAGGEINAVQLRKQDPVSFVSAKVPL